jgi:hypothetical protein
MIIFYKLMFVNKNWPNDCEVNIVELKKELEELYIYSLYFSALVFI